MLLRRVGIAPCRFCHPRPWQAQCPRTYPRGQNRSQKQCELSVPASDFAYPTHPAALLHLLAHQVESLERRFVRHHEEVGIAAARLVAREGPMRDREHVMLRPFDGLFANARAALARDPRTDIMDSPR